LRLYAGLLTLGLLANGIGFTATETLRRLGPVPLGKDLTFSTLVTDRDGKLLRPFITHDGYWRLPVTADDVDPRPRCHRHETRYEHGGTSAALMRAGCGATSGHVVRRLTRRCRARAVQGRNAG
jgi:membrane carboxypeptidase/penicillin-binding protein PbpC